MTHTHVQSHTVIDRLNMKMSAQLSSLNQFAPTAVQLASAMWSSLGMRKARNATRLFRQLRWASRSARGEQGVLERRAGSVRGEQAVLGAAGSVREGGDVAET